MRVRAAAAALLLVAASEQPETFANDELGLEVSFPAGAATCQDAAAKRDRVAMFLDGGLDGCEQLDQRPYIEIRASENFEKFATPQQAVAELCGSARGDAPPNLSFAARRSAACRSDSPDTSWVDVFVVTQADGEEVAKLDYQAQLHTTLERLRDDVVAFRGFLAHDVRLTRPEWVDTTDSLCQSARTPAEQRECGSKRARRAEAELARREAQLEKIATPDQVRALDQARDAWLEYRRLQCEAVASLQASSACATVLTDERARELERILDQNTSPAAPR